LTGGDVADAVGVFLGQLRQGDHLLRVDAAEGDLDPLHAGGVPHRVGALGERLVGQLLRLDAVVAMAVVVALAVGAAAEARLGDSPSSASGASTAAGTCLRAGGRRLAPCRRMIARQKSCSDNSALDTLVNSLRAEVNSSL